MRLTDEPMDLYAHCTDALCPGHKQVTVPGIRQTISRTFGDTGHEQGIRSSDPIDIAYAQIESVSHTYFKFADDKDAACPHCEQPRTVTDQERPKYERQSGQDPDELLRRKAASRGMTLLDANGAKVLEARIAELEAQLNAKPNGKAAA